jgi:hypothetical protein
VSAAFSVDDAEAAGRLISYGLRPKQAPARNAAYADLVRRYREDNTFQQLTMGFAAGLGLMILEVSPRAGIVVAATNESAFEIKLDSYAKRARIRERRDVEKVLHGIIHLAVAALCFPRPDDLANDTYVGRVSVEQVDTAVREACRVLDEKVGGNEDPPADAPELEQVWRAYARRPEVMSTRAVRRRLPRPAEWSSGRLASWRTRDSWSRCEGTRERSIAPPPATRSRFGNWPPTTRSRNYWTLASSR